MANCLIVLYQYLMTEHILTITVLQRIGQLFGSKVEAIAETVMSAVAFAGGSEDAAKHHMKRAAESGIKAGAKKIVR